MNVVEAIPWQVLVDPPRNRFRLLIAIPTVADPLRAAYLTAIVKEVRRIFVKHGVADPSTLTTAQVALIVPDVNGWMVLP